MASRWRSSLRRATVTSSGRRFNGHTLLVDPNLGPHGALAQVLIDPGYLGSPDIGALYAREFAARRHSVDESHRVGWRITRGGFDRLRCQPRSAGRPEPADVRPGRPTRAAAAHGPSNAIALGRQTVYLLPTGVDDLHQLRQSGPGDRACARGAPRGPGPQRVVGPHDSAGAGVRRRHPGGTRGGPVRDRALVVPLRAFQLGESRGR